MSSSSAPTTQDAAPPGLVDRLQALRDGVTSAAVASGRGADDVQILLATKTISPAVIRAAISAGYDLIGENRVQEVVAKADELADLPHRTHLIGHLQSNKVNAVLDHVDCVQSVDSVALAGRLDRRCAALGRALDVMVQVNVSGEASKSGVAPDAVDELVAAVLAAEHLRLTGFMTIGLRSDDRSAVRAGYAELAAIRDRVHGSGVPGARRAVELSMGMSGDWADAIAEGATMVRVGSAVFGARPPVS